MNLVKNRKILIDTNVLVYCSDGSYGKEAKKLLRMLANNNNKLATSELSCFELIKNAFDRKYRDYYLSLINYIDNHPVTPSTIMNGWNIYHAYIQESSNKKSIGSLDILIGSTAVTNNALLLTGNRKDFPMPFWKLVAQTHMIRKNGEADDIQNVYLLEFDVATYKTYIEAFTAKLEKTD